MGAFFVLALRAFIPGLLSLVASPRARAGFRYAAQCGIKESSAQP